MSVTILGIDPGSRFTGYGIIAENKNQPTCITHGRIRVKGDSLADRLFYIYTELKEIMATHQPDEVAIEQVFFHRNAQSALTLGQARGAALVAAAALALPVAEYSPKQVKQAAVGYGSADKTQVQRMVCALLKLNETPEVDAADALAIAICHSHSRQGYRSV